MPRAQCLLAGIEQLSREKGISQKEDHLVILHLLTVVRIKMLALLVLQFQGPVMVQGAVKEGEKLRELLKGGS